MGHNRLYIHMKNLQPIELQLTFRLYNPGYVPYHALMIMYQFDQEQAQSLELPQANLKNYTNTNG